LQHEWIAGDSPVLDSLDEAKAALRAAWEQQNPYWLGRRSGSDMLGLSL
jgi:hypothetical protein